MTNSSDQALVLAMVCLLAFVSDAPAQGTGRIAGTVVDASTGRPVAGASIEVVATGIRAITDLEGRYRTVPVPVGLRTVQVNMIGYAPTRIDSVRVTAGHVAMMNVSLELQAIEVEGLVAAVSGQRAASAAGLLAVQKNAPSVMDGISAEQMSRSPDSDAADAISRVTGVSVVDDKFVVVRGLTERYSNTLLNGVELASPEPTRRIVPLDIFPSTLLESIVAVKTATPDLPGDFAGGSVNIQTKDFPEQRVLELKVSQGYNSLSTFKQLPVLRRNGFGDLLGFDGADRMRSLPARGQRDANRLAKSVRTNWTPQPYQVRPELGVSVQYGDQLGQFERALGYVVSFDYGLKTGYEPAEYFALADAGGTPLIESSSEHSITTVDWGLLANATLRLGTSHTLSVKNLLTQESEEFALVNQAAFNADTEGGFGPVIHRYQVRYVERGFLQTQLRGQHRFSWPFTSQWNWTATLSNATRDEPENRTLNYVDDAGQYVISSWKPNAYWFRFLDDRNLGANLDVSIPLSRWFGDAAALVKVGIGDRQKQRDFDAYRFNLVPIDNPPDGVDVYALPPEQLVAPENLGRNVAVRTLPPGGLPYSATDEVRAAYLMADLPLFGVRLVGGVRMEQWRLAMTAFEAPTQTDSIVKRNDNDLLLSFNATVPLSERMNLRLAGYQTVSRPDTRELSRGQYVPVAGKCTQVGFPDLTRAQILNGDVRWEWYPGPGELISLSGFYKYFKDAIVEYVSLAETTCSVSPLNARQADIRGGEIELRKGLGFVNSALGNFSLGLNFTYALGSADLVIGTINQPGLALQDLSKYVANGSIGYASPEAGLAATVLYNYFGDRVSLYGNIDGNNNKMPDIIEKGRGTLDLKVTKRFKSVTASLSGKNLTNEVTREVQQTSTGDLPVGLTRQGVSLSLSFGYAF